MIFALTSSVEDEEPIIGLPIEYDADSLGITGPAKEWRKAHVQRLLKYNVFTPVAESEWDGDIIDVIWDDE